MKNPAPILTFMSALMLATIPFLRAEDEAETVTEVAVQVAKVVRTTLARAVTAYGTVEPEPAAKDQSAAWVKLSPAVAGIIAEVNAVEGQAVEKGDILFKLDSRAAEADKVQAEKAVEFAQAAVERQHKLMTAEGTSERQVMEAEQTLATAQTGLAAAEVRQALLVGAAPIAGIVVKLSARQGEAADPAIVLAEIADPDRVVASVRVPMSEAASLKVGLEASLRGADLDAPVAAAISLVSPQVDPATNTLAVRLAVAKGSGLRAGGFVTARIVTERHTGILAVPRAAVYTDHDGVSTLSTVDGDVAKKITVKIGLREGDLIEVVGPGLDEGTTVVTVGSYALPEETKVRISEAPAKEEAK